MAGEQIRLLVIEDVPQVAAHMRQLLQAQSQIKMLDVVTAGERAVAAVSMVHVNSRRVMGCMGVI